MSLLDVILHPCLWLAAVLYFLTSISLAWSHARLEQCLRSRVLLWYWEHIGLPLLRILALLLFIFLSYPLIYGQTSAPALMDLLAQPSGRPQSLINILFLLALLLPLLPGSERWQALILPVQGIVALGLLGKWLALRLDIAALHVWPGWPTAFLLLVLIMLSMRLLPVIAEGLGNQIDHVLHIHGNNEFLAQALALLIQIPVLVIYGLSLGGQLNQ
ncbi:MAG: hypothetical protein WD572_10655 [Gammaproteobacteria bacterium]